jgi:uncharacterized protein YjbJ (UPF0337 family)
LSNDAIFLSAEGGTERLTADDLIVTNGRREELEGKIQQRYGLQRDQVRKEVDDWFTSQGF